MLYYILSLTESVRSAVHAVGVLKYYIGDGYSSSELMSEQSIYY